MCFCHYFYFIIFLLKWRKQGLQVGGVQHVANHISFSTPFFTPVKTKCYDSNLGATSSVSLLKLGGGGLTSDTLVVFYLDYFS